MSSVTAVLVVRDEEFFLPLTLRSIMQQADHVFVLDTGSADGTMEVLARSGVAHERKDFGGAYRFDGGSYIGGKGSSDAGPYREMEARNYALETAVRLFSPDWILRMDADESFHPRLFEAIRAEGHANAFGFGCEMPVGHSPFTLSRLPESMSSPSGAPLHDPHIFAWRERTHRARWSHPAGHHVAISGLPQAKWINEPVHFHYHRAFGPKSIYTYLYWEQAFAGKPVAYGAIDWLVGEITGQNFRDDKIYRRLMPERFDSAGRFRVPKVVTEYFRDKSVAVHGHTPETFILDAYRNYISYE